MPCGQKTKTGNKNSIVTNSISTLKWSTLKKKNKTLKNTIKMKEWIYVLCITDSLWCILETNIML